MQCTYFIIIPLSFVHVACYLFNFFNFLIKVNIFFPFKNNHTLEYSPLITSIKYVFPFPKRIGMTVKLTNHGQSI